MTGSYQEFSIVLIVFFYTIFCVVVVWMKRKKPKTKDNRTSFVWELAILNGLFFSIGLIILIAILPQPPSTILSWIVYDFLITYILCIELPSYLRISNFDDDLENILKGLREELIKMPFSFGASLQNLKTKRNNNLSYLQGENIDKLLEDFIAFCDKLGNRNDRLWSLTLNEISSSIDEVSKRSKHPFPKLIDIAALSGLSVLIAQILKLID